MAAYFWLLVCSSCLIFGKITTGQFPDFRGRALEDTCMPMPQNMSICRGLGYETMFIPNLLGHDSMSEAVNQAQPWKALIGVGCSQFTQMFLCSMFAPVCTKGINAPIPPCQDLCMEVRNSCAAKMDFHGYKWPSYFNCSSFPRGPGLCISIDREREKGLETGPPKCSACKIANTYEGIVHAYCKADFMVKMKIRKLKLDDGRTFLTTRPSSPDKSKKVKIKFYKSTSKKKDRRALIGGSHLLEEHECVCDKNRVSSGEYHMVGGTRAGDGTVRITFATLWKEPGGNTKLAIKKAIRTLRKSKDVNVNMCKGGHDMLSIHSDTDQEVDIQEQHRRRQRALKKAAALSFLHKSY